MMSASLVRAKRLKLEARFKDTPGESFYLADIPFTCDTCRDNETCREAFDAAYNTDGDCLAEK